MDERSNVAHAVGLALRGRVGAAEHMLRENSHVEHLFGLTLLKALQALLSEDDRDVTDALAQLQTVNTAALHPVLAACVVLLSSLVLLRTGSMLRGAWALRKAWKAFEVHLDSGEHGDQGGIASAVSFGGGFFLFGCSMLPASVGWVLERIGFRCVQSCRAGAVRGGY